METTMIEAMDLTTMFSDYDFDFFGKNDNAFWTALPAVPDIENDRVASSRGINPVVQTFFEGPEKCECCINWVEKQPVEMPESEKERYEGAAICLYRRKDHEKKGSRVGGLIAMTDDRLVLQSQVLIDLVRPHLAKFGFLVNKTGEVEFSSPFKELYFSYGAIFEHKQRLPPSSDEGRYLALLTEVMTSLLLDTTSTVTQLISKQSIDYRHLWTLFPKNVVVYWKKGHHDMLGQVYKSDIIYSDHQSSTVGPHKQLRTKRTEIGLRVWWRYIAFDGVNFGLLEKEVLVRPFEGDKLIKSLPIYPIGFHPQADITKRLCERGGRVLDFQDSVHCEYEGTAEEALRDYSVHVTGRVLVDTFRFEMLHPDFQEWTEPVEDDLLTELFVPGSAGDTQDTFTVKEAQKHRDMPRISYALHRRPTFAEQQANRDYFASNRHLLMLMYPFLKGFSLKRNQWFELDVSKLSSIKWTERALDILIFNSSIKQMLSSFARHHASSMRTDTSVLASKGTGLPILLSGPPGTGKTLTAEVVAEETRLPLYRVLAGELGSKPSAIESALTEILDLASYWQCIVLLDEVDTFISTRTSGDRTSSEIVSIFLRQMEYYRGIIFLTTNLPRNIDSAFRSRCRLHIQYQPLGLESRSELWKSNFDRAGLYNGSRLDSDGRSIKVDLTEAELASISEWKLSGRDIHNIVQNAVLWSISDSSDVTYARLLTSLQLTVPFASKTSFESSEDGGTEICVEAGAPAPAPARSSRKRPRPSDRNTGSESDAFGETL